MHDYSCIDRSWAYTASVIDSAVDLDLLSPLAASLDRFQHDLAVVTACLGALTVLCSRHGMITVACCLWHDAVCTESNSNALRPHHPVLHAVATRHAGEVKTVQTIMFLVNE